MQSAASINSMVLMFLERKDASEGRTELGLHPLDICRTSMLKVPRQKYYYTWIKNDLFL
jgi:hypothetical protein